MEMLLLALGFCVSILIWNSFKLLQKVWWTPKMIEKKLREQGIHGLPYKLFYGNNKEKINLLKKSSLGLNSQLSHDIVPRIYPLLHTLSMNYGKTFVVWDGTTPRVTVMDVKLIREMLSKIFEFEKKQEHPSMKLFLTGIANYNGEKWTKHRKMINPAFQTEKLKKMLPSFMICCEEMIKKWEDLFGSSSANELDVLPEFQNLTADVISRAAFGCNFQEGRKIFSLQKEQGFLFLQSFFNSRFPWSRFLPSNSKLHKRMKQIHEEVKSLTLGIIEKREEVIESGKTEIDEDLLDVLLKFNLKVVKESKNPNFGITREDLIEECKLFYFAGHETTANLLTWTMIALSMHLDWQEKARKEVLQQIVRKGKPTYEDLNHLKIVNMILLEVLRLYPPTSIVRCVNEETKLGEISLPEGTVIEIPVSIVQRDPELWGEDAMEFNPERFSNGISEASKGLNSFLSFGWGPRICIGQSFAMLEAKLALAMILQSFSFELSNSYTHAPGIVLTLQPRFGAQIILHKI